MTASHRLLHQLLFSPDVSLTAQYHHRGLVSNRRWSTGSRANKFEGSTGAWNSYSTCRVLEIQVLPTNNDLRAPLWTVSTDGSSVDTVTPATACGQHCTLLPHNCAPQHLPRQLPVSSLLTSQANIESSAGPSWTNGELDGEMECQQRWHDILLVRQVLGTTESPFRQALEYLDWTMSEDARRPLFDIFQPMFPFTQDIPTKTMPPMPQAHDEQVDAGLDRGPDCATKHCLAMARRSLLGQCSQGLHAELLDWAPHSADAKPPSMFAVQGRSGAPSEHRRCCGGRPACAEDERINPHTIWMSFSWQLSLGDVSTCTLYLVGDRRDDGGLCHGTSDFRPSSLLPRSPNVRSGMYWVWETMSRYTGNPSTYLPHRSIARQTSSAFSTHCGDLCASPTACFDNFGIIAAAAIFGCNCQGKGSAEWIIERGQWNPTTAETSPAKARQHEQHRRHNT
ncbi:uncharacterized protein MYCFIDRAFT_175580 [Pseudocercospora fijiensis CIRAD86]|uniref:Uncharacterized protein n=1 Tax=Pseudocercospora fijiensis (strain CIRAD86) TaxID=383855 RepID=M3ABS6_PSEFD|nr:uncharacterized protein MYCFIDRAFT_175580 [Pseudocercospora fijiensis CIRAD86]EME82026.1 hypothetical protein MYCFIDRAFT_175580 [Pseudocercospora fijiensis CIRAD86]